MKLNKNTFLVVVFCIAYLASKEIAGDAKLLADINYLRHLGFLDIGWKTIVTIKTNIIGNTDFANTLFIYTIQLVSLTAIYRTAIKTNKKLLTAILLTTLLIPIAIRVQLRLGFAVSLWIYSITSYIGDKKSVRLILTSIVASSMHQGIAFINTIILLSLLLNKINLRIKKIRLPKKSMALIISIAMLTSLALSSQIITLAAASITAISDKSGSILPTISTLSSIINQSDSFQRSEISKVLSITYTSTLVILVFLGDKFKRQFLRHSCRYKFHSWILYDLLIQIFAVTAFINITFSGLEYFGRIGSLCYPVYALIIIIIDIESKRYETRIKDFNHLFYIIPSLMGVARFIGN